MTDLSVLTPRESEILRLMLAGRTNKAIAAELFLSPKTVEFHINHIYSKTGRRSRLLAGIWALRQGMQLPRDEPN